MDAVRDMYSLIQLKCGVMKYVKLIIFFKFGTMYYTYMFYWAYLWSFLDFPAWSQGEVKS